jgi:exodeoxyribonuclease V alpha subunit
MKQALTGQLDRIVYQNPENLYTVGKLNVDGSTEPVTIVGQLSGCNPGETLKLSGRWERHPKYGRQFKAESCSVQLPAEVKEIEKYLASGVIKGLGPETAKRMIRKFGKSTLATLENSPEKLTAVPGIGPKRLKTIRKAWEDQKDVREVLIFLQGQGIGPAHRARILKEYGQETIRLVRENPYRLSADITGIGFLTADNIAKKIGVSQNALIRAEAGLVHILEKLSEEGHVFGRYHDVMNRARELLTVDDMVLEHALGRLCKAKRVVVEDLNEESAHLPGKEKAVYLKAFHAAETGLANRIQAFCSVPVSRLALQDEDLKRIVHKRLAVLLSQEQWGALQTTISSKLSIITGGPGTGKTTLIKAVLAVFQQARKRVRLCAPTGRAAKRLSEVTGERTETIHRMLSYDFKTGNFQKNEENPLNTDLVIADEASMIDLFLMYHLLRAIPVSASLILVGDINQLPAVGPGNVLRDLIDSGQAPTVYLTEIFRQAGESLIIVNAHRINQGLFPKLVRPGPGGLSDFYLIEQEDPERIVTSITDLCGKRIPDRFDLDPFSEIQVLTPMHRGIVGTTNLNSVLQQALNPSGNSVTRMGVSFREGDKVMQVRNNYTKEVFNGDIGTITKIDARSATVTVSYEDVPVDYEAAELDELILAYAISVHKSQGSEYPAVVMPVTTQHFILLQKNLIYTGISRAKELVVLIGSKKALRIAIGNDTPQHRLTRLSDRLKRQNLGRYRP